MKHTQVRGSAKVRGKIWLGNLAVKGTQIPKITAAVDAARKAEIAERQAIKSKAQYLMGAWTVTTHDPEHVGRRAAGIAPRQAISLASTYPGGRSA